MTSSTPKRYGVIGNPIAHSRSPFIHHAFAQQTGLAVDYARILAPVDDFDSVMDAFFSGGGCGLNVTVPFKETAANLAARLSPRARLAGAVNTLWMESEQLHGCNTDGLGLLYDLERLGHSPEDKNILLIGAGGAAKGVVFPLLEAGCSHLRVVNRSPERARQLHAHVHGHMPQLARQLGWGSLDDAQGPWDIVINATSSSLTALHLDIPAGIIGPDTLAYDMVYAAAPTTFMRQAAASGARLTADGLGMLVGQAAASFLIWHNVKPMIEPVLQALREHLAAP